MNTVSINDVLYCFIHGQNPPPKEKCQHAPAEFDWESANEPDPYYCWQGTRLPQWFE